MKQLFRASIWLLKYPVQSSNVTQKSLDTSELLDLIHEMKMSSEHFYFLMCKKLDKIKFWKYSHSLTKKDIDMQSVANERKNQMI